MAEYFTRKTRRKTVKTNSKLIVVQKVKRIYFIAISYKKKIKKAKN